jgi:hypothetical protein
MPVYCDDALIEAKVRNGRVVHDDRWSHLVATTPRELHDFATRALGLQRSYFQDHWRYPHYDLNVAKRAQALNNGAIPIEYGDPEALALGRWLPPVLVTSSREGVEVDDVDGGLKPHFDPRRVLISGGARGGDQMSESLWQYWGGEVDRHAVTKVQWNASREAGFQRNEGMVAKTVKRGGECVALVAPCTEARCRRPEPHGTHGASHCADVARAEGLAVDAVPIGGRPSAWRPNDHPRRFRELDEPAPHNWQSTADPNRKECACGVAAMQSGAGNARRISFLVPGPPASPEPVSHLDTPAVRLQPGLQARPVQEPEPAPEPEEGPEPRYPSASHPVTGRSFWWGVNYQTRQCDCGTSYIRPAGSQNDADYPNGCMKCDQAVRSAQAAPKARDEVARAVTWNADVGLSPAAAPAINAAAESDEGGPDREAGS